MHSHAAIRSIMPMRGAGLSGSRSRRTRRSPTACASVNRSASRWCTTTTRDYRDEWWPTGVETLEGMRAART